MKRGFLLSMDALIAISLLIMISIFLVGLSYTYSSPDIRYQRYYYAGKDVANLFEMTSLDSVSFLPVVQDYLSLGVLEQEDMNRSVLDVVGSFWASGNRSYAENLTRDFVNALLNNTAYGFEILMNGESIYQNGSVNPDYLTRLTTIVSGYEKDRPVNGYVAKVYMTRVRKTGSGFLYFGGYVGDGNISRFITLPDDSNVTNVYLELNVGGNFTLYINGQDAGMYAKTKGNFSADNWIVCSESVNPSYCSYFAGGNNSISINFTERLNNYIGGGYLKVMYRTSELTGSDYMYTGNTTLGKYWFPGIKGLINLYSSFYVPGTLKNMSIHLHYKNNLTLNNVSIPLYFVIGSEEIFNSNETGERILDIPDFNISGIFGGKANLTKILSNATIPIRFGTETFTFISGEAASDSVLITDISGTMEQSCDVQTSECLHPDCNEASGCQNWRIDVAKDVDKEFVNTILNYTGNRAGLVSYATVVDEIHPLGNDSSSLISQIDGYDAGGWTCISCGIRVARDMIVDSRIVNRIIPSKSSWLYNTGYPSSEPPDDVNGTSWTEHNYTDSGWNQGQAILGFEGSPYIPNVDTDIGNNNGSYYFRKHFNISDANSVKFGEVYILFDDNAEIYINGYLIDNDTEEHRAEYWNRGGIVFYDDFESYYASGANRLYSNEINLSPGFWMVDGTPDADKEVFLMAGYSGYPSHGGTDVLVFRDMDAYGYAETSLNLSGESDLTLSYWWAMGPGEIESGDYSDVWVWDGSWHEVKKYNMSHVYGGYVKEEIYLSGYNMIENFTVRFGVRMASGFFDNGDEERFYVDDVRVSKSRIYVDRSYFRNGDNVVAVKLRNNDGEGAKFDLELNVTKDRHEAILVMSDGYANRPPGLNASKDAVDRACETRDIYDMHTYVVAFGVGADNETLRRIACWNCSADDWITNCNRFYKSSSAEELKNIYKDIADEIANATYEAQIFNVTGNVSLDNILYPDSFISFNYTPIVKTLEYGEITLKFESPRFRTSTGEVMITDNATGTKEGWFTIPSNTEVVTKVLDSKVTSYSSYYWTDRLWVNSTNTPNQNWTRIYWLGNFSDDYEKLGDPYIIQIPPDLLTPGGNNSLKIGTGLYPSLENGLGGSPDDRVIYTLGITGVGLTEYSDVFPKARGSKPTIYYDMDGDNIPESYVTVEIGPYPNDVFDPENDSIDNGFMKLMDKINFIADLNPNVVDLTHNQTGPTGNGEGSLNNPIDLEVTEEVKFQSDYISRIPSLWGPATMEVRVWS